jgi:protein-tyrosine phosphatase
MVPLADVHVHLLAGLDDGPRTPEDAVEMCRLLCAEGVQMAAATAHQNERWSAVTPDRIREATSQLRERLREAGVPLTVFPCAEVTARTDLADAWERGQLLSVGDRKRYLLLEMPDQVFVDLRPLVRQARQAGLRPILAHPERQPEVLHEPGRLEELIRAGCLVQVSSRNVTDPRTGADERALRGWFRRDCVHLLGSDGHSPRRRPPRMAEAYRRIRGWAGPAVADRVCGANGMAVLQGVPLQVPEPRPPRAWWPLKLW